jgi:hypothetical protein
MIGGAYRLVAALVVVAFMAAATVIMAAAWIVVILGGVVHPRLTPRRACDWSVAFIREAVAVVRGLG